MDLFENVPIKEKELVSRLKHTPYYHLVWELTQELGYKINTKVYGEKDRQLVVKLAKPSEVSQNEYDASIHIILFENIIQIEGINVGDNLRFLELGHKLICMAVSAISAMNHKIKFVQLSFADYNYTTDPFIQSFRSSSLSEITLQDLKTYVSNNIKHETDKTKKFTLVNWYIGMGFHHKPTKAMDTRMRTSVDEILANCGKKLVLWQDKQSLAQQLSKLSKS